jgi:hypothetical protein
MKHSVIAWLLFAACLTLLPSASAAPGNMLAVPNAPAAVSTLDSFDANDPDVQNQGRTVAFSLLGICLAGLLGIWTVDNHYRKGKAQKPIR